MILDDALGWKVAGVIGGLWMGALSLFFGELWRKVMRIERDKADTKRLDEIAADMKETLRETEDRAVASRERMYGKLDETITNFNSKFDATLGRISDNASRISRIEGQLGRRNSGGEHDRAR